MPPGRTGRSRWYLPGRGKTAAAARASHALEHDHRDLAVGLRLVLVIVRPDLVHQPPQSVALAFGGARAGVELVALDLHLDLGVLRQVAIPAGIVRRAALRRHDDGVVAVELVDEWRRVLLTGLAAGRRKQEDSRAFAPVVALCAVGRLIAVDMLLSE